MELNISNRAFVDKGRDDSRLYYFSTFHAFTDKVEVLGKRVSELETLVYIHYDGSKSWLSLLLFFTPHLPQI
jgi:hypothetical protein